MNSRERVLSAINHKEPDRIPLDLGATRVTGIAACILSRLRKYLNLSDRPVKVYDIYQLLGEVEMDLIDYFEIDILPIETPVPYVGLKEDYKSFSLFDETKVLVPKEFQVETTDKGDWLLHENFNIDKPVVAKMPKNGHYFDKVADLKFNFNFEPPPLQDIDEELILSKEKLSYISAKARRFRDETDKALLLSCLENVGLHQVGSLPEFLILLKLNKGYVKELMSIREKDTIENLKMLWKKIGKNVDIVSVDARDFGTQKAEFISPADFEEIYFPHYKAVNEWIHKNTTWKTWLHSDGSIVNIIPLLIESGLDILNPIECTAAGMDPKLLKERYGDKLTFWGGGVDPQKTFPFGTPEEVVKQVRERIDIFASGGGFVFSPINNIQSDVTLENIVAFYKTALKYGKYRR